VATWVRFLADSSTLAMDTLTMSRDCSTVTIPMKGKAGKISLNFGGDLNFGTIVTGYPYSRKIKLFNTGSIAATVTAQWQVL
jgi:hypothetical protein